MKICDFKGSFQKVSAKKYGIFHILVDTLTSLTYGKYTNDPTRPPYIWKIPNVFCRYFLKASLKVTNFHNLLKGIWLKIFFINCVSACSATQGAPQAAPAWPSTGTGAASPSPTSGWPLSPWWQMFSLRARTSGLMGSLSGKCSH